MFKILKIQCKIIYIMDILENEYTIQIQYKHIYIYIYIYIYNGHFR